MLLCLAVDLQPRGRYSRRRHCYRGLDEEGWRVGKTEKEGEIL